MFKSDNTIRLRQQLDQFTIPMFIVELRPPDGEFGLLAINSCYEAQSGMTMADVIKRPVSAVLPANEARKANERYAKCIHQDAPLRYREKLHLPRGALIWDTSLSRIELPDCRERLVGSAVVVERVRRDNRDTLAFEDVSYFATTSSMRLEQIASVLAAVEQQIIPPERLVGSVGVLAGLCRSIDATMQELRSIAQERLGVEKDALPLINLDNEGDPQSRAEVVDAIDALIQLANEFPASSNLQPPPDNQFQNASAPDIKRR